MALYNYLKDIYKRVKNLAVFDHLSVVLDRRKEGDACVFNGYLEDFLNVKEDLPYHELFTELLALDNEFRICVGLGFNVNKNVISNQIIRYKDASKLPEKAMKCPYILYTNKDGEQKGIVLSEDYLLSKGYYYCLTEQYAILENSRNELVSMSLDNQDLVVEKVQKFLNPKSRAGAIQREVDNYYYRNIKELIEIATAEAEEEVRNARETLPEMEDKTEFIYSAVSKWYLLKKVIYVSYMMNKDILNTECEKDIKKQRFNAKNYADAIPFIAYSEMWRMKKEEQ